MQIFVFLTCSDNKPYPCTVWLAVRCPYSVVFHLNNLTLGQTDHKHKAEPVGILIGYILINMLKS
jgi:hypothetical protein